MSRGFSVSRDFYRAVVYEDSETFYPINIIRQNITSLGGYYTAIKHDHDIIEFDETSENYNADLVKQFNELDSPDLWPYGLSDEGKPLKKAHWHFIFQFDKNIPDTQVKRALGAVGQIHLFDCLPQKANRNTVYRYLYHFDDFDKFDYWNYLVDTIGQNPTINIKDRFYTSLDQEVLESYLTSKDTIDIDIDHWVEDVLLFINNSVDVTYMITKWSDRFIRSYLSLNNMRIQKNKLSYIPYNSIETGNSSNNLTKLHEQLKGLSLDNCSPEVKTFIESQINYKGL